ncbi:hypothetical protein FACS1894162_0800 [Bacteroidia bacterium]|nr:hypothetical protein FACS1894162_0800 [Bacteroidia bacterium]
MKKEFGKLLIDIAKYMITGIFLSTFFSEVHEEKTIYVISLIIVIIMIVFGLYFVKEPETKKKRG